MTTIISSRTPEGHPGDCPICDMRIWIEPSAPAGDAPCLGCGTLLWFIQTSAGVSIYESEAVASEVEKIIKFIATDLGVREDQILDQRFFLQEVGADSLDIVELLMELEEEFDLSLPEEEVAHFKTVNDVIDWILRHRFR